MYIANPIYDTAFKYMMEDNKIAKKFISTIIREDVVELNLAAQEVEIETDKGLMICHLDFVAKIATDDGFKTVIIELQKSKLASDIIRFRRYVGQHYQSTDNIYEDKGSMRGRQIYCIFLLNHSIGYPNVPMLEVDSNVIDTATGKQLSSARNEFVESLHHRSWIVQIPQLKEHRRNDIENLLSIFDQSNVSSNKRTLDVNEEDFPEEYRDIIRRLLRAYATPEVRRRMEAEDDYLELLRDEERKAAAATAEKDKVIAEKAKIIEERDKALEGKDKVIEEKDKTIEENAKALEENAKTIAALYAELESLKHKNK
jgi:hypothetical protein